MVIFGPGLRLTGEYLGVAVLVKMFMYVFHFIIVMIGGSQTETKRHTSQTNVKRAKRTRTLQDKRETCKTNENDLTCVLNGGKLGLVGNSEDIDIELNNI